MSQYEKFVPVETREVVAAIVDMARATLEKEGVLHPVAFVGSVPDDVSVMGNLSNVSKDNAVRLVRAFAKKKNADFVLWIDEAWLKTFDAPSYADANRIREEVGGEVRNMPGRIDVVWFNLHTHGGVFLAHAVREGEPGHYTFGAVKFHQPDMAEGRFMNLLPPREPKPQ